MSQGKKHTAEQIIVKLHESEVAISQDQTSASAAKLIGVTAQTYFRWRKKYGGLRTDQAKRLKDLEKESARLKRLLAAAVAQTAIITPRSGLKGTIFEAVWGIAWPRAPSEGCWASPKPRRFRYFCQCQYSDGF